MHFSLRPIQILSFLLLVCSASIQLAAAAEGDQQQQEASSEYTDDDDFRDAVLNVTNTYRKQHNATALRWNQSLADGAVKWSKRYVFEHSVCILLFSHRGVKDGLSNETADRLTHNAAQIQRRLTTIAGRSHWRKPLLRLRQRICIHHSLGTRKSR
jgi:hypothetical protein